MNKKVKYLGFFVLAAAAVLFLAKKVDPKPVVLQQHLTYNTQVEDTSLSIDKDTFSSRLPVVSIDTGGETIPGRPAKGQTVRQVVNSYVRAQVSIWEKEGRRNTLSDQADVSTQADIRIRGNSSRLFDKAGYLVKFVDDKGKDNPRKVMGMEKNSTWVLHGPYLDKTLMRNYMWYNLAGQIMEWAPDARFCEVFLNGSYQGLYVMVEQISVGEGRIEIKKYDGRADVSSYIVCADRQSINDVYYLENLSNYTRRTQSRLEVKYPGTKKMTPELNEYISKDFSKFEKSLYSFDYDTNLYGYENYIDSTNFAQYFLINEITQNTDAGIYSTYFYKDVRGKLKMAVWDFNNCCDNYMEDETPMAGFVMQDYTWFFMLTKDEKFVEKIINEYQELRQGLLSDEAVRSYITDVQEYLGAAVERNYKVWGYSFDPEKDLLPEGRKIGSYEEAMEQYEHRLISRLGWMDKNIDSLRACSHESVNKKYNH